MVEVEQETAHVLVIDFASPVCFFLRYNLAHTHTHTHTELNVGNEEMKNYSFIILLLVSLKMSKSWPSGSIPGGNQIFLILYC